MLSLLFCEEFANLTITMAFLHENACSIAHFLMGRGCFDVEKPSHLAIAIGSPLMIPLGDLLAFYRSEMVVPLCSSQASEG